MPTTAWWIIPRTRRRPLRQREPRRPQPSAEAALRLSVPEVRTSVPEFIPCQPTNAELAARLEQVAAVVPEPVASVSLTGPSANSGSAPAPRSDKPSPKTSDTRSSLVNPRKVTKPSLASRLRVLLAPAVGVPDARPSHGPRMAGRPHAVPRTRCRRIDRQQPPAPGRRHGSGKDRCKS